MLVECPDCEEYIKINKKEGEIIEYSECYAQLEPNAGTGRHISASDAGLRKSAWSLKQVISLAMEHFLDYNITIEKIAEELCVTSQTVIKWEQGINKLSKRNQKNINKMYEEMKTDSYYWNSESEILEIKYGYW